MELININNVTVKYKNGVVALRDVSVKIKKGDFVFLIGGSGSGKSTFTKMLYREIRPDSGEIILGGINVAKLRDGKVYKLRRKLGVVFQDYRLLPKLTVYENVAFALEAMGAKKSDIQVQVLKAIELVGLKSKTRMYPRELSGGEQQRVAIARAIVNNPKLLICDEPTGNLDPERSMEVIKVLSNINKTMGTTVIVATHDKDIVNKLKKRVITLRDGRIITDLEKGKYDENI